MANPDIRKLIALLMGQEQDPAPKRIQDVPPEPDVPPQPGPAPVNQISPEQSALMQSRNAAEGDVKNRAETLLLRLLKGSQGYKYTDRPLGGFEGGRHDEQKADIDKLYSSKPGGYSSVVRDFMKKYPQAEVDPRIEGEARNIEDMESKLLGFLDANKVPNPPLAGFKKDQYKSELGNVKAGLASAVTGDQAARLRSEEARLGNLLGGTAQPDTAKSATPPSLSGGGPVPEGYGEITQEEKEAEANAPLLESLKRYQAESAAERQAAGAVKARELAEFGTAKAFGDAEAQTADEAAAAEAEANRPEDPYERYLRMLSEGPEEKETGILGALAALGLGFGGASPDQIIGVVDQLKGGPDYRQKLSKAGTAAQMYSSRAEAQANRQQGLQREAIEQAGQMTRAQQEAKERRSNLEFTEGQAGARQQAGLQSDLVQTILKLQGQDKGPSYADKDRMLARQTDALDVLIRDASDQINAQRRDIAVTGVPGKLAAVEEEHRKKMALYAELRKKIFEDFNAQIPGGAMMPPDVSQIYKGEMEGYQALRKLAPK